MRVKKGVSMKRNVVLLRTVRAMLRAMCEMRLIDRKNTKELMKVFNVALRTERMVKAAAVRWLGHVSILN